MKKSIFLLLSFLCFTASESNCWLHETNFYAKLFGGVNLLQNTSLNENSATYKPGYIIAGSIGYRLCYGLRLEAEYAYRRNDIKRIDFFIDDFSENGHVKTSSYMANLLWDIPLSLCVCNHIQPFFGGGLGYDSQHMHSSNDRFDFSQKWNHFAWQVMAGFAYPIFCQTEMIFEYKFHDGGSNFYNHSFGFAFLYQFGCL